MGEISVELKREYISPNGHIIRVHRSELTPEERERRMKQIKRAAADLLIAAEKAKANTRKQESLRR